MANIFMTDKPLIRESVSDYKHIDLGNIKLAFTQVCNDELFAGVYFAAHALYYVQSGTAVMSTSSGTVTVLKNQLVLIKQHSKIDITKFKDEDGSDFKSIIFYLFPDYILEFAKSKKLSASVDKHYQSSNIIKLSKTLPFQVFCKELFKQSIRPDKEFLKLKTFEALDILVQENKSLLTFLANNVNPIKIDLYEFMVNNILSGYTTKELARLTGRSLSAFKRDFEAIFNISPHKWLLLKRIDYAEMLLKEGQQAARIYYHLGFKELSHFSAAFKKVKGVNPTAV